MPTKHNRLRISRKHIIDARETRILSLEATVKQGNRVIVDQSMQIEKLQEKIKKIGLSQGGKLSTADQVYVDLRIIEINEGVIEAASFNRYIHFGGEDVTATSSDKTVKVKAGQTLTIRVK